MAIKKRDGTIYQLRGPNLTMRGQEFWDQFQVHNLKWEREVRKPKKEIAQSISDFKIKSPKDFSQIPKQEASIILKSEPVLPEAAVEVEAEVEAEVKGVKTRMYCLPVVYEENQDSLYLESRPTWKYGEKAILEAVVVEQNDFTMVFWTKIKLETGSIIFPINKDKRWWKINKNQKIDVGYLYQVIPSTIHPDFT